MPEVKNLKVFRIILTQIDVVCKFLHDNKMHICQKSIKFENKIKRQLINNRWLMKMR